MLITKYFGLVVFAIDFVCRIESQPFTYDLVASVSILYGVTVSV